MGTFNVLPAAYPPQLHNMEHVLPFQAGQTYWQVDLRGRDVVEGLARIYKRRQVAEMVGSAVSRAQQAFNEIERANAVFPNTYAVYIRHDEGIPTAMVYERIAS